MASMLYLSEDDTHIHMRLRLDNGRIEEIDAYRAGDGWTYHTSADNNPALPKPEISAEIVKTFKALYSAAYVPWNKSTLTLKGERDHV